MTSDIRHFLKVTKNMKEDNSKMQKIIKKIILEDFREKKIGFINPVIVTFQNGELNDKKASDFSVELTPKSGGGTEVEARSSYGHVFKDSNCNETVGLKRIIAIRNRKTNKMKLVEVDSAVLINSNLLKTESTEMSVLDFHKDFRELKKTFGGKKIVSQLNQRDKVNVSSMIVAEDVKETVADITIEEDISLKETEMESIKELLPPCHRDSKVLSGVYVLSEILSQAEIESLDSEIKSLEENKAKMKEHSEFFIQCYNEAKKSKDDLDNRLAGILFAETLIKFIKIPSKKLMSKKVVLCPFSPIIHEKLLNKFCIKTDSSVTRPLTMRDKSLCYIIAISLACCNYQINLKLLATVTSIHLNRLSRLAQVVGATELSKVDHTFCLKLPLRPLPKSSMKMKRK